LAAFNSTIHCIGNACAGGLPEKGLSFSLANISHNIWRSLFSRGYTFSHE
jgi:hypothetical protein